MSSVDDWLRPLHTHTHTQTQTLIICMYVSLYGMMHCSAGVRRCEENPGEAPTINIRQGERVYSGFVANNDISNEQIFNWTTTVKRNTRCCERNAFNTAASPRHRKRERKAREKDESNAREGYRLCLYVEMLSSLVVFLFATREENSVKRLESLSV